MQLLQQSSPDKIDKNKSGKFSTICMRLNIDIGHILNTLVQIKYKKSPPSLCLLHFIQGQRTRTTVFCLARNTKDLNILMENLIKQAQNIGLKINQEKTKYMKGERNYDRDVIQTVKIENYDFERVEEFTYLLTNDKINRKPEIDSAVARMCSIPQIQTVF